MKSCWRALGVVVFGTSLVACIKIAPFAEKDAGSDATDAPSDSAVPVTGAIATPMGGGVDVMNGSLYRVWFSSDQFHYPFNMMVGTTQVIGGGNGVGCADEYGVGIGLYPAGRITGHTLDPNVAVMQNDIRIEFAGPPVAKVALDWGTQLPCSGTPQTVTGRSTFTLFPDGRINRSDQVHLGAALDSTMCTCGGADSWYLTSFFTANAATVQTVFGATVPGDSITSNPFANSWACFNGFNNSYQFAMGWRLPVSSRLRAPVAGSSGTLAFVRDLTPGGAATSLGPTDLEGQTTWWVATDSNCTSLQDKVRPYSNNSGLSFPTLNVQPGTTGQVLSFGVALDGIFGGENGAGSMGYQSSAPDIHLTVDENIGAFAFWLALGSGEEIESVVKSPSTPTDPWYFQQKRTGSNHRLFWFPDGLNVGEEIVIRIQ